jgi:hypothetical protein
LRTERRGDKPFAAAVAALATSLGGALGGATAGWRGVGLGILAGGALGAAFFVRREVRRARRSRALAHPFPEQWRLWLESFCDHYGRLPEALRRSFEDDLRLFLAEARITGVGVEVTDDERLLVASSAVTLSLGWPEYEWGQLTEVLLYPDDFDRDYGFEKADLAGQAHPWGTIILSVPALFESIEDPDEPFHVGLHEFAHLIDMDAAHFDGIPEGLDEKGILEWMKLVEDEMDRLRRGDSALDPYGDEDPVEFLAVAVEAFFKTPLEMRRRHQRLYDNLARYFRQDPAAWEDERGEELQ